MPFTFAHPAAVLPIHRRWPRPFVLSALIIGSMSPDFAYLPPFGGTRTFSHSFMGTILFCVPAAFLVYLVFHLLLKAPLASLLPPPLERRAAATLRSTPGLPARSLVVVLASLWLGSLTHALWDSFTHAGNRTSEALPFLRTVLFHVGAYRVELCRVLQHFSTFLGAVVLFRALRRAWREGVSLDGPGTPLPAFPPERLLAAGLLFLGIPLVTAFAWRGEDWRIARDAGAAYTALFVTVVTGLGVLGVVLVAYAVLWHSWRALARRS